MTLFDLPDGRSVGHFCIPTLYAHMLRKIIHAMASPRRHHVGKPATGGGDDGARARMADRERDSGARAGSAAAEPQGEKPPLVDLDTVPHADPRPGPVDGQPPPADSSVRDVRDGLTWKQRYGRAFVDLLAHLPTDHLHPKTAATVVAHIDHAWLRSQVAQAVGTDTAHRMSAGEWRRTACGAGILPAVYTSASVPIDFGCTSRLFTAHQRLLLAETYPTCAAAGCDRPFAWTEIHHVVPWTPTAAGGSRGPTDLGNALPLCGHHHRLIHHPHYRHDIRTENSDRSPFATGKRTPKGNSSDASARTQAGEGTSPAVYTVTYRRRQ